MSEKLPIGTRIVFVKLLDEAACGDHPELVYAYKGDEGEVTGRSLVEKTEKRLRRNIKAHHMMGLSFYLHISIIFRIFV